MKVNNKGKSVIRISRGDLNISINPGINLLPEYDWIETIVGRNSNLEYISDIEINSTGVVSEESKIINPAKLIIKNDKADKKTSKKTNSEPAKKRRSRKKNEDKDD